MKLYDSVVPSGNGYKVHLLLHQLELPFEVQDLDFLLNPPETRRPEFLRINPNGRIPTLVLDNGEVLAESGAILYYLAQGTPYFPDTPLEQAQVLQWMFFEQYSHEPYVAVLKYWTFWGGLENLTPKELDKLVVRGQAALDVMSQHLTKGNAFFVAGRYSIADIALYAYTQSAEKTGFTVSPVIKAWLSRVEQQPGYVPIKADPYGKYR